MSQRHNPHIQTSSTEIYEGDALE